MIEKGVGRNDTKGERMGKRWKWRGERQEGEKQEMLAPLYVLEITTEGK